VKENILHMGRSTSYASHGMHAGATSVSDMNGASTVVGQPAADLERS